MAAPFDCDLLIIGSGFAGSVCALRAAEAGMRVIVIERGRRWGDAEYAALNRGRAPLFRRNGRNGLFDVPRLQCLGVVAGNALGGGSHVYTAVTIRPEPDVFDDRWPTGINWRRLGPLYDRVQNEIAPVILDQPLPRARRLESVADALGGRCVRLPLALTTDAPRSAPPGRFAGAFRVELTDWLRGGLATTKRTLDQSYLRRAESAGAAVRCQTEAVHVARRNAAYTVAVRRSDRKTSATTNLCAPRVVLAAGTVNSLRLLLRARDDEALPGLSATLGHNFYTNGDFGAVLVRPDAPFLPDDGPPVTAWIDWWRPDRLRLMETGIWPRGRKVGHAWSFSVMGDEDAPAQLRLGRNGKFTRVATREDAAYRARVRRRLRDLADAARTRLIMPPDGIVRRWPVTVHPMGGAAIAASPRHGVVGPDGQVFGCPGLYVADASIFPRPLGAPPSMSIAALAELLMERMLATC